MEKKQNEKKTINLVLVSGGSGSGKSSLLTSVAQNMNKQDVVFAQFKPIATRPMRVDNNGNVIEKQGDEYNFIDLGSPEEEELKRRARHKEGVVQRISVEKNPDGISYAYFYDLEKQISELIENNHKLKVVASTVDYEGMKAIRKFAEENSFSFPFKIYVTTMFIEGSSTDRVNKRSNVSEEELLARQKHAEQMEAHKHEYNFIYKNKDCKTPEEIKTQLNNLSNYIIKDLKQVDEEINFRQTAPKKSANKILEKYNLNEPKRSGPQTSINK